MVGTTAQSLLETRHAEETARILKLVTEWCDSSLKSIETDQEATSLEKQQRRETVLRAAVSNEELDLGFLAKLDETNARLIEERAGNSIAELVDEVAAESEETQALLAQLAAEDEERSQEGAPMLLGVYLRGFPEHDRGHLNDLKTSLEKRS